jgi:hypothetical protein
MSSCKQKDISAKGNLRLKTSYLALEIEKEKRVFWSEYKFDKQNKLVSKISNDTIFYKTIDTYLPISTVIIYNYDANNYLNSRNTKILSTTSNVNSTTQFTYFENKLIRERSENSETVFNYDDSKKLINTVTTSINTGNKIITDYNDDVPKNYEKNDNGYLLKTINSNSFFNTNLLLEKYQLFANGILSYFEEYEFGTGINPLTALPNFLGFPKIKAFSYKNGIEKSRKRVSIINDQNVLLEERSLNQKYNSENYLIENKGFDILNANTENPQRRTIINVFTYEHY